MMRSGHTTRKLQIQKRNKSLRTEGQKESIQKPNERKKKLDQKIVNNKKTFHCTEL